MRPALRRSGSRLAAIATLAVVPLIGLSAPASAAPVEVVFDCEADAPVVGKQYVDLPQGAAVTAPETVAPGGTLDIVIDPSPNTVPGDVNGYTLKEVKDFGLKIPIPENSTFVSAELEGGSGIGDTPPTIDVADGMATLSFPGPIAGGADFELPTVNVALTAGDSGTIETTLAGTSYTDPGLTFTAVVNQIVDISVPTACFPNPSPTFTTTTIG